MGFFAVRISEFIFDGFLQSDWLQERSVYEAVPTACCKWWPGLDSLVKHGLEHGLDSFVKHGLEHGLDSLVKHGLEHGLESLVKHGLEHGLDSLNNMDWNMDWTHWSNMLK